MTVSLHDLNAWLQGKENEHLEFKEAKNNFHFDKAVKYCAALANERGGRLILGVTDKKPRKVVGTKAFEDPERTKAGIIERLRLRIEVEELAHPDGRVLVFAIPSRPLGTPISVEGAYWMRAGEDLAPMTPDMLARIFAETGPDFSAELCPAAKFEDLEAAAIEKFRGLWIRKSGNDALKRIAVPQLLVDAELAREGKTTYAALVLFGTREALGRLLPQAEVVFEYRSGEAAGPAQDRRDFREGFFSFGDDLWETINLRNDVQHFQDGLFVASIPTFNQAAVREALLNAVTHRDYRLGGSVFVRQYARRLEIVSPGGFLPGINPENVLWRQAPRNRRIAEAFQRCGLVERSGQGIDRMFEASIKEGKPRPDFSGTDDYQVSVTLRGEVQDPAFLRFLERVGAERTASFTTSDLLVLDLIRREEAVPEHLRGRLPALVDDGVIERMGKGRATTYILSRALYGLMRAKGRYTRKRGLDRETQKELLLKHVRDCADQGAPLSELAQVLPELPIGRVQGLMRELKSEGKVVPVGKTRASRWHLPPSP